MNSPNEIWGKVLKILEKEFTSTTMVTWFKDTEGIDMTDETVVVSAPSEMCRNILMKKYVEHIKAALYELFSCDFKVIILTPAEAAEYAKHGTAGDRSFSVNDEYTFDRFVVGNSNKFAYAAARAVADQPAGPYNPLFIYGESGLGKTHLLYAIANDTLRQHPDFRVVYVKGEEFTNELVAAIREGKNTEFRNKYRYADVLLVDDIQFIAGRPQTMEEFFHTFNALYEAKKQIVLASDRPPREMNRLEDRLRSRFEWGLTADIQPPEYETRVAILREKAKQMGITLPDAAVDYIASNVSANVRQLEGTVKKIMALASMMDSDVNSDIISRSVEDAVQISVLDNTPTADDIIEAVAKYYILDEESIRGPGKKKEPLLARQIAMKLIRDMTSLTLDEIGEAFGGRDHATVLNSINRVEKYMQSNAGFADTIRDIKANINNRT